MKCANCQKDLHIPEGRKSGFCSNCGTAFNVEDKKQSVDTDFEKRIVGQTIAALDERYDLPRKKQKGDDDKSGDKGKGTGDDGNNPPKSGGKWSE